MQFPESLVKDDVMLTSLMTSFVFSGESPALQCRLLRRTGFPAIYSVTATVNFDRRFEGFPVVEQFQKIYFRNPRNETFPMASHGSLTLLLGGWIQQMAIAQSFPSKGKKLYEIGSGRLMYKIDDNLDGCAMFIESCLPLWLFWALRVLITLLFMGVHLIFRLFMKILEKLVRRLSKEFQIYDDASDLLNNACVHLKEECKNSGSYHRYYTNPILEATRQNSYEVVNSIAISFPGAILSANEDDHNIIQKLKDFVCPLSIIQKNYFEETPQMVFTRGHKELVFEGEKWIKRTAETAESYAITGALITTIVFAAAITVPGGTNQETRIPIFTNKTIFTIFAISDAISLFTAVTSLLLFLSILTAHFAEQDFLFKLPTKLMIGLSALFISTTDMIVAFASTLYLVFGQSNSRILISIAILTCLPITSFVTLQFPLVVELMNATYGLKYFW
ncbi:hypothetical protein LXL04_027902 [Taraxacum kok-saghyz]